MHRPDLRSSLPRRAATSTLILVVLALASGAAAQCPPAGGTALPPGAGEDLEVTSPYTVCAGTYHYGNVNVYGGGSLIFDDAAIDFWATSILIENQGSIVAGSPEQPIGTNGGTVTFHLYGKDQGAKPFGTAVGLGGQGITCKSPGGLCGVPPSIWQTDPTEKVSLPGGVTDFFYAYDPLPYDDGGTVKGYFGYKVLALSYGGTLELFGKKGATYGTVDPSNSGTSWVRLAQTLAAGGTKLVLDRPVDWGGRRPDRRHDDRLPSRPLRAADHRQGRGERRQDDRHGDDAGELQPQWPALRPEHAARPPRHGDRRRRDARRRRAPVAQHPHRLRG